MDSIKTDLINPFINATQSVLDDISSIESRLGKAQLRNPDYKGEIVAVIVGVTGELNGQVIFAMAKDVACEVAGGMMGTAPAAKLNDMAKSAVEEMANMVMGNTATIFSNRGTLIEITHPNLCIGENMRFDVGGLKNVCVPFNRDDGSLLLEVNIALREA